MSEPLTADEIAIYETWSTGEYPAGTFAAGPENLRRLIATIRSLQAELLASDHVGTIGQLQHTVDLLKAENERLCEESRRWQEHALNHASRADNALDENAHLVALLREAMQLQSGYARRENGRLPAVVREWRKEANVVLATHGETA